MITFFLLQVVAAQGLPSPTILPDHPLYGMKRFWERVQLWFKFDPLAKARFHIYLSKIRLAEANEMVKRNKLQFVDNLIREGEIEINVSENILDREESYGRNVSEVEESLANATHEDIIVIDELSEKVPQPIRKRLEHVRNISARRILKILAKIRVRNPERASRLAARFAEIDLNKSRAMFLIGRIRIARRRLELYRKLVNETSESNEIAEKLGGNITALAEHACKMLYKHINVLEDVLEKVPEEAKPAIERAINNSLRNYEKCMERITKIMNRSVERVKLRNCTTDEDCEKALTYCPSKFGFEPTCYIPPNRTTGICRCWPTWKKTWINCTEDEDCKQLVCTMVIGSDTPICKDGRCVCGSKWI
ncbi:MAG TPA: hypothetical protein ENG34_01165, partial [Candidatus Aenigmarchaeota archaeon]|nr:hypothetical protein [Candidatus Aenigmarchaeota archaeon]